MEYLTICSFFAISAVVSIVTLNLRVDQRLSIQL